MRPVCHGATLLCSCGIAPSVLRVRPSSVGHSQAGAALVTDCIPILNIAPFAGCTALGNPQPSLGPLRACVPSICTQWSLKTPNIRLDQVPVLEDDATLLCAYGGVIRVLEPGQRTTRHTVEHE